MIDKQTILDALQKVYSSKYYFLIQRKDKKLFLSNALQTMKYCMCQNVPLTDKILNDVNSHLISNCGTGDSPTSPPYHLYAYAKIAIGLSTCYSQKSLRSASLKIKVYAVMYMYVLEFFHLSQ